MYIEIKLETFVMEHFSSKRNRVKTNRFCYINLKEHNLTKKEGKK